MQIESPVRRNDIDWLRVFATYLLFVFHAGMIFSPAPFFHVRNHEVSAFMLVLTGFISLWHMPLFFLLAGWAAHSSLVARGGSNFVRERLWRLAVPLIAGCILIGPVLKWFELESGLDLNATGLRVASHLQDSFKSVIPQGLPVAPPFNETFLEFLPTFYTRLERFTWGHLWFVAYLLTFTLLYLPLLKRIVRSRSRIKEVNPFWVYAPVVPLALVQVVLRPHWPGIQNLYDDWANFAYYSCFLLLGFLLGQHPGFEATVVAERRRALMLSLGVMLALLLGLLRIFESPFLLLAGSAAAGWCFIVAMLGYARRVLSRADKGLAYLRESAFPIYILHQPVLVVIGYAVVGTALGIAAKYLLIVAAAVPATLGIYHFLVRPHAMLRVMHGMKAAPRRRSSGPVPALPTAVGLVLMLVWESHAMSPVGTWWTEGGAAKVQIHACGDFLCGDVVWLRSPFDESGCELRDTRNPDAILKERHVVGLRILKDLRSAEDGRWTGGSVYDPESGKTYRCTLTIKDDDSLLLRGYLGIPMLGRTTRWFRVGSEAERCRSRPSAPPRQDLEG
jgi:uncharacterized protein (DUF2147 family)/fucose 4-O-acetylase-like acetyltransferase